jgi:3-hydroxyisobutyrate dehydrogenase-like beta-hydroxyacid dehydrogenase
VLGGYGAVGTEVTSQLRAGGDDYLVAGRDPARADQVVNLHQSGAATHRTALAGVDVVANAAGVEDPALAAIAAERGAAFVDITATSAYVARLERLRPPRPVLVSVVLHPG